jgi:hypothetical protein
VHAGTFAVPTDFTAVEVTLWYAERPGDAGAPISSRPWSRTFLRSTTVAAGLLTAWIIAGLSLLVTSIFIAGRLARRVGPDAARIAAFVEGMDRSSALADRSDTLEMLLVVSEHPRTKAVRALAQSQLGQLPSEGDLSSSIRTALEANAAGAVLAAARGDLEAAAGRLGENAAIAELALDSPGPYWSETGLRMLHALVLLPLAEVERLRGNLSREAELRRAATGVAETIYRFGPSLRVGAIGLGGDPRDLRLLQQLKTNPAVPSGLRAVAVEESGNAACLNPRKSLAGVDSARYSELGERQPTPEPFRRRGIASVISRIQYCADLSRT